MRRRSVRLALAVALLAVAAGACGLSAAAMHDHALAGTATLTGGRLVLHTDHAATSVLDAGEMRPGGHRTGTIELRNDGTVAATASVRLTELQDVPEAAALSGVLELRLDDCGTDAACAAPAPLYDGSLRDFATAPIGALPAGGRRVVRVSLDWGVTKDDPSRQGATVSGVLVWTAVAGASA
jgi:hypothetical protein